MGGTPNDIEFSGERKRVRCNALLGCAFAGYLRDHRRRDAETVDSEYGL
jgi:hypothetical protein